MKSTKEIMGLKIISIADGTQVGTVKDLILNPAGGLLDFFMIDKQSDYIGDRAKVIAFKDIKGLGEYAITIADPKVMQNISSNNQLLELIDKDVKVIGTKVLTIQGTIIGEVTEIYFDELTGEISQCLYETLTEEQKIVKKDSIVTYGRDLLIINNEPLQEEKTPFDVSPEANTPINIFPEVNTVVTPITSTPYVFKSPETTSTENKVEKDSFNMFEQHQMEFIVGKKVSIDIKLNDTDTLLAGQTITNDTINKITKRSTLIEITSNLQKG